MAPLETLIFYSSIADRKLPANAIERDLNVLERQTARTHLPEIVRILTEPRNGRKTPEEIAAEKTEREAIYTEIQRRINHAQSVLEGSQQQAAEWKARAFKAMQLSGWEPASLNDLRTAVDNLCAY
ncbi:hypothetical protein [Burkholderia sp. TSV86]|uniref:hypothetical protein n=1 Tax=Burkholderia sp. TSV86 TaxID=1385594 RepID=UPI000A7A358D|nr:hypothetical protein [Burkholderia sp. TSV86]